MLFLQSKVATHILAGGELTIGRLNCTIDLSEDRSVSRSHATIIVDNDLVVLKDNNSRYGTFVNMKQLPNGSSMELHRGDAIRFGVSGSEFVVVDCIELKLFCSNWVVPSCSLEEAEYVVLDGCSVDVLKALGRAVPLKREFPDACLSQKRLLNPKDFVRTVNREALYGYNLPGFEFFGSTPNGIRLSIGCASTAWISEEDLWNACIHGRELQLHEAESTTGGTSASYYARPSGTLKKLSTPLTGNQVSLLRQSMPPQNNDDTSVKERGGMKRFVKNWPVSRQGSRLPRIVNLTHSSSENKKKATPTTESKKRRDEWFDEPQRQPPKQPSTSIQINKPIVKQPQAADIEGPSRFKSSFFKSLGK